MDFVTFDLRNKRPEVESCTNIRVYPSGGQLALITCDEASGRIIMQHDE